MKKRSSLFVALAMGVAVLLVSSCGHMQDISMGSGEDEARFVSSDGEEEVHLTVGQRTKDAVESTSSSVIVAVVTSVLSEFGYPAIPTSNKAAYANSRSETNYKNIAGSIDGAQGGFAFISGDAQVIENRYGHCSMMLHLMLDLSEYEPSEGEVYSGEAEMRVIASSHSCRYHRNMHIDASVEGSIFTDGLDISEITSSADYLLDDGWDVVIESGVVDTEEGYLYCFPNVFGDTECFDTDKRELPSEVTTCSSDMTIRQECDPTIDSFYTQIYLFEEGNPLSYEAALVCSDDGLWTPPCPLDGSYDICPAGGVCAPADDGDWGAGLEGFGYCSCN